MTVASVIEAIVLVTLCSFYIVVTNEFERTLPNLYASFISPVSHTAASVEFSMIYLSYQ